MSTNHTECALITPDPYQGTVRKAKTPLTSNEEWPVVMAAAYYKLPPLIVREGDWVVSRLGIHNLFVRYDIPKSDFDDNDLIERITEKPWANVNDFRSVLDLAKKMVELEII